VHGRARRGNIGCRSCGGACRGVGSSCCRLSRTQRFSRAGICASCRPPPRQAPSPHFLFVWDGSRRLLGVCPLERPGRLQARVWTHEQAPLGTPLLDRERAEEALAAIFAFCREHWPKVVGLMFPSLPQDGPTARLLIALANAEGRSVRRFAVYRRACSLAARTRSMTSNDRFGQSDGKTSIERAGGFRPRAPCASAC